MALSRQEIITNRIPIKAREAGTDSLALSLPGCITVDFGNGKLIIAPSLKDVRFIEGQVRFTKGASDFPKFYASEDVWKRDDQ